MKDLIPLLEILEIKNAISIDDDYKDNPAIPLTLINDFLDAHSELFTAEEIDYIYDGGWQTVRDCLDDASLSGVIKDKITQACSSGDISRKSLDFLAQGFEDSSISFSKYSDVADVSLAQEEGSILFLDKEMGGADALRSVLPKLAEEQTSAARLFVVFTHDDEFGKLNQSYDKRLEHLRSIGIDETLAEQLAYSFFVILKKKISELLTLSIDKAQSYLSDEIRQSLHGFCLSNILSKIQIHANNSLVKLSEITKDTTANTVEHLYYNILKEGDSNLYCGLNNIFHLMQEEEFTSDYEIKKYTLCSKRLAALPYSNDAKLCAKGILDLVQHFEWAHFQFLHDNINDSYSDIAYGDVFALDAVSISDEPKTVGVVITQPCDCTIHNNGRKTQKITLAIFPVESFTAEDLNRPTGNKDKTQKWEETIKSLRDRAVIIGKQILPDASWKAYYINADTIKKAIQIEPFILDLASLNKEGKSILLDDASLKTAIASHKPSNWNRYADSVLAALHFYNELLSELPPEKSKQMLESIYEVPFSAETQQFMIVRLGRLETNLVEFISYHYVAHTYRTGKNSLLSIHTDEEIKNEVLV